MACVPILIGRFSVGYEDGEVGAMQLAPAASRAFLWMGYDDASIVTLLEHTQRTELDAQVTAFAPIGEDGDSAARQAPASGATAAV